jgi:hypothetical protein
MVVGRRMIRIEGDRVRADRRDRLDNARDGQQQTNGDQLYTQSNPRQFQGLMSQASPQ